MLCCSMAASSVVTLGKIYVSVKRLHRRAPKPDARIRLDMSPPASSRMGLSDFSVPKYICGNDGTAIVTLLLTTSECADSLVCFLSASGK